jgi:hypothetical protein
MDMRNEQLNQKRFETRNEVVDQIKHLLERFDQRLTLDNLRLAERYIESKLHLLVHFCIGGIDEEFVACLQRKHTVIGPEESFGEVEVLTEFIGPQPLHMCSHMGTQVKAAEGGANGKNQAVFIDIVKSVEDPERVIPSLVWFDRVDRVYGTLPHALYFSGSFSFVYRGIVNNRKVDVLERPLPVCSHKDQMISQMVQGAPEILENVTNNGGYSDRNIADAGQIINELSRLRIALGPDYIWLGIKEGSDPAFQVTDVLFGPFNFYPDKRESFVSGHNFQGGNL